MTSQHEAAGLTITKLRASLDPHNVDMILFVHKNHTFPELSNVNVLPVAAAAAPVAINTPLPHAQAEGVPTSSGVTQVKAEAPGLPALIVPSDIDSD